MLSFYGGQKTRPRHVHATQKKPSGHKNLQMKRSDFETKKSPKPQGLRTPSTHSEKCRRQRERRNRRKNLS